MSLVRYNMINWLDKLFKGHDAFKGTMLRKRFQTIHSNIVFADPDGYNHELASADLMWHLCNFLDHFMKNLSAVAVPVGASALDECTARTKAHIKAKTYMLKKLDKYGIRFYVVVGAKDVYLPSLLDNR